MHINTCYVNIYIKSQRLENSNSYPSNLIFQLRLEEVETTPKQS